MRLRLVLLVLLASVPLLGITLYTAQEIRRAEIFSSHSEMQDLARIAEDRLDTMMTTSETLLYALSQVPAVARGDTEACARQYEEIRRSSPRYTSLVVADERGVARCDNAGARSTLQIGDRDYFVRARATGRFAVGAPVVSRLSGRTVIPLAYPLHDAQGNFRGVIASGIDLQLFGDVFVERLFKRDLIFNIWDPQGGLLYPAAQGSPGAHTASGIGRAVLAREAHMETVEVSGLDGVASFYVIMGLERQVGARAALSLGIPLAYLRERSDRAFLRIFVYFSIVFAVCIAAALALAEFTVRRRVAALSAAAERLAAGDLGSRTGLAHSRDELGAVGRAFDTMAATLQQREAELRRAHDMARLAHVVTGAGGVFESWSANLPKLAGVEPAAMPRSTREWLALLHPADRAAFRAKALDAEAAAARVDVEYRLRHPDGGWIHIRQAMEPISGQDAEGRGVLRWINTLQDVSEERAAAEEIRRLNTDLERRVNERTAQLERANAMKSEFLANMSHELRTPLNAIIGFSEVLKDGLAGELNERQRQFIGDIYASGRHLLELINDILDLSKVEAGMLSIAREPVDLRRLLEGALSIVKEKAQKRSLRIDTTIEPGLDTFSADPRRVKQILYNFLSNAVKFTPEGGAVTLAARRVPREAVALPAGMPGRLPALAPGETREFVELSVRDTGVGIPAADLEKLFQPFVQVDSALSRRAQGTGLGLAMVLNLARLHGGTAGVASEPEKGSLFCVWLPLEAAAQPAERAALAVERDVIPGDLLALVIEDDDSAARLIEQQLKKEGLRTIRAATGEEGLVRAAKERPGLVTLDIFLPGMSGWQVIGRMKADPRLAEIPVVIISIDRDLARGVSLGATRVLQKPFTRPELAEALQGIVPTGPGEAPKVLIVDDNPQAIDLLARYLAEIGATCLRAYGGREAIEAAGRARPDLILLDLMMPEVSGFDVVQALKARPETAAIPIVVVTAKDLTAEDRAGLEGHVARVMRKTEFDGGHFIGEVRRALGGARAGG